MFKDPLFQLMAVLYVGMGALLVAPPPEEPPRPHPAPTQAAALDAGRPALDSSFFDALAPTAAGYPATSGNRRGDCPGASQTISR